jgi:hypothetical protein
MVATLTLRVPNSAAIVKRSLRFGLAILAVIQPTPIELYKNAGAIRTVVPSPLRKAFGLLPATGTRTTITPINVKGRSRKPEERECPAS